MALHHYFDAGCLPVGGDKQSCYSLVDLQTIHAVLKFLDIPKQKWKAAVDDTA